MIALETLVQSEFEWPKYFSHDPLLEYEGSRDYKLSFKRFKNCLPFTSKA